MRLGAGRSRVEDAIDPAVGVLLYNKVGDHVAEGEPLCSVMANAEGPALDRALADIAAAYTIGSEPVPPPELILERLD